MSEQKRIRVFGPFALIGSFVEVIPEYDDWKVAEVEPDPDSGYEISGDQIQPRAWWVTLEPADPVEVQAYRDAVDENYQQHMSGWQKVFGR